MVRIKAFRSLENAEFRVQNAECRTQNGFWHAEPPFPGLNADADD
jgi:hypothetical protein